VSLLDQSIDRLSERVTRGMARATSRRSTHSTLGGPPAGRNACGSGLHSVTAAGSKACHTVASA
jgi:hypothetical protein